MLKTLGRHLLLQQLRSPGRGLPFLVNQGRGRVLAQCAHFLKDSDKAPLVASAEARLVGPDGEVQDAHSGVLLHGEHAEVVVGNLDLQDAPKGADGGLSELPEVAVLRTLV